MKRKNFPTIIRQLRAKGLTQAEIGLRMGVAQSQVSDLMHGKIVEPKYHAGAELVALHAEVCGR